MNTQNTQNTRNTSSNPSMPFMVGTNHYYDLFSPGGTYHEYFMEMLKHTEKEDDLLYILIKFASMGVICGIKEARRKGGKI